MAFGLPDNPFTYCSYDLSTGRFLGRLPYGQVSFGSQILNPGTFSGTIDIASASMQALDPLGLTQPARTALLIDYEGAFVWAGIIWSRSYTFDGQKRQLQVNATELWSYFNSRMQATDYSAPPYSGITGPSTAMAIWNASSNNNTWDANLIAWQILSDALYNVPYADLFGGMGIALNNYTTTAAYLASGTNAPLQSYLSVNYPYASLQSIATLINQLATNGLTVGFDYAVDVAGSAGGPVTATVNLSYPRRGRLYSQNGLVMNCQQAVKYQIPEDGSQAGNTVYEQGMSGSLSVSQNSSPLGAYPVLEQLKSRANITSADINLVLQLLGASDLAQFSFPVATPVVTFDLFTGPIPLGSFIVGDDTRLLVPATDGVGNAFDPRFPNGWDEEWRINGYQAQVPDAGQATIDFTLGIPPSLSILGPPLPT